VKPAEKWKPDCRRYAITNSVIFCK